VTQSRQRTVFRQKPEKRFWIGSFGNRPTLIPRLVLKFTIEVSLSLTNTTDLVIENVYCKKRDLNFFNKWHLLCLITTTKVKMLFLIITCFYQYCLQTGIQESKRHVLQWACPGIVDSDVWFLWWMDAATLSTPVVGGAFAPAAAVIALCWLH